MEQKKVEEMLRLVEHFAKPFTLYNENTIYDSVTVLHYIGTLAKVVHNPHGNDI